MDSFLYPNEEDVDELLSVLGIGRYHCLQCTSWKTAPLGKVWSDCGMGEMLFGGRDW